MKNKKGNSAWIWILIVLILIIAGISIYFWLTVDTSIVSNLSGGSIPQPPALPSG